MEIDFENLRLEHIPPSRRKGNTEAEIIRNYKEEYGYFNSLNITLYHGSNKIIEEPKILLDGYTKDFGFGFYTTNSKEQAESWAVRKARVSGSPIVTVYELDYTYKKLLNKMYSNMSEEWLDFIVQCRKDRNYKHGYDTVEGPMADDKVFNVVDDYVSGKISREAFWALCRFKHPTHQLVLNTEEALRYLKIKRWYNV